MNPRASCRLRGGGFPKARLRNRHRMRPGQVRANIKDSLPGLARPVELRAVENGLLRLWQDRQAPARISKIRENGAAGEI